MTKLLRDVRAAAGSSTVDDALKKACRGRGGRVTEIAEEILTEARARLSNEEE